MTSRAHDHYIDDVLTRLQDQVEAQAVEIKRLRGVAVACMKETDAARAEIERLTVHYNLLRDALSWFDAHNIDHLPQWVVSARRALNCDEEN
jgi:hypothetical protein